MSEPSNKGNMWNELLGREDSSFHRQSRVLKTLPSSPRCHVCYAPFGGVGGVLMRLTGRGPSRMNPYMCDYCDKVAKCNPGGAEIPLTMLFADIRGSTPLAESLGTTQFSNLIARFYDAVTGVLIHENGLIDRLIGDEVIALFVPGLAGAKHAEAAVRAAQGILRATGHDDPGGPWVPVGVGVHTGMAFVGAVGSSGVHDITALGDEVNLTARLASLAGPGEILITEAARAASGLSTEGLEPRRLELKGRKEAVDAWLMHIGVAPVADAEARATAG